jgi:hypothetical protein
MANTATAMREPIGIPFFPPKPRNDSLANGSIIRTRQSNQSVKFVSTDTSVAQSP